MKIIYLMFYEGKFYYSDYQSKFTLREHFQSKERLSILVPQHLMCPEYQIL